jgi:hypothetical protein
MSLYFQSITGNKASTNNSRNKYNVTSVQEKVITSKY